MQPQERPKREIGIEILRIIAMFLIVCYHFLYHGGILKNAGEYDFFLRLVYVLFAPAVNVFVLISGYFSANTRKHKWGKLAELWLRVLFYSLLMTGIAAAFGVTVTGEFWVQSFFPILFNRYWFFSAYLLLSLAIPYLSAMVNAITQKQHLALVIGAFACGYAASVFSVRTVLPLNWGYSFLWFCFLFVVGAYLRKYPPRLPKWTSAVIYVSTSALLLLFQYVKAHAEHPIGKLFYSTADYNQPLTLLAAVALLLLFLGIPAGKGRVSRLITAISSCTFGVYLIHDAPAFRRVLYGTIFDTPRYYGRPTTVLYVLLFAAITFTVGVLADTARALLFRLVGRAVGRIRKKTAK